MAEQLKFFTVLSLKDISLRRVVAVLRSNADISASVPKFHAPKFGTKELRLNWRQVAEDQVVEGKVANLELPETLKKLMLEVVRPISKEVERWKHYLKGNEIRLPDSTKLFWTTVGQIDYRKTAKELVRCDALDVVHRYQLACLNCLEDDIPLIWKKLTEESKKRFICFGEPALELTAFWSYIIRGELTGLDYLLKSTDRNFTSFNQWAFEHSAVNGNKVATKYFFQKLTYKERESSLVYTVKAVLDNGDISRFNLRWRNENLSDVFCYLLTLLTPQQQLETIQAHPVHTLLNFFFCPCQDLFLLNAGLLWSFVPAITYSYLVRLMIKRYRKFFFDFPNPFREFIMQSPPNLRKFLGDTEMGQYLGRICFYLFHDCRDLESMKALLRNLYAVDRVKFVFNPCIHDMLCRLISKNHWPLVKMCLQEVSLSKEEKKRMKDAFENSREYREQNKSNFKKCFEFLEETETSANDRRKAQKRKLENCSPD